MVDGIQLDNCVVILYTPFILQEQLTWRSI